MKDYETGKKEGALLFGNTLIELIEEGESQGHQLTSKDYKTAILNLLSHLEQLDTTRQSPRKIHA